MSHAGINIRKIRTLKGISQSELAKRLKINRASVGSYEEGRAEPKLETLLKIANLFSISVERLVGSELKMNDLIGFKLDDESSELPNGSILTQKIPLFYSQDIISNESGNLSGFSRHITLPLSQNTQRASFSVADYSMRSVNGGPVPKDLLICELSTSPSVGIPVVVVANKSWFFGRLSALSEKTASLKFDNRNFAPREIDLANSHSFWVLTGLFSSSLLF